MARRDRPTTPRHRPPLTDKPEAGQRKPLCRPGSRDRAASHHHLTQGRPKGRHPQGGGPRRCEPCLRGGGELHFGVTAAGRDVVQPVLLSLIDRQTPPQLRRRPLRPVPAQRLRRRRKPLRRILIRLLPIRTRRHRHQRGQLAQVVRVRLAPLCGPRTGASWRGASFETRGIERRLGPAECRPCRVRGKRGAAAPQRLELRAPLRASPAPTGPTPIKCIACTYGCNMRSSSACTGADVVGL